MPCEIRIPRLGWSMEEGTFIQWLKQPGEHVAVGELLYELEGEKAVQEIEATDSGTLYLTADAPLPGSTVAVGTLLGFLLVPGEPIQTVATMIHGKNEGASIARADHVTSGGDRSQPVHAAGDRAQPIASPRARRVAAELGIDWTTLEGSGRGGRIREADVVAAKGRAAALHKLSPRRRIIADRLRLSRDRTVPVTLTTLANADRLVAWREQFKSTHADVVPSYTDLVASLVARVLMRHPQFAVRWDAEHASLVPVPQDQFHIGIAVHTSDGLLVPVIRGVLHKPAASIARESLGLIARARSGQLTASEMQGGVLTITNLGAFGIDAFTPVINLPEVAILGLGVIRREAIVTEDTHIVPGYRLTLSLTFDHTAIDGAPAAAFLHDIAVAMCHAVADRPRSDSQVDILRQ